jgi:hypothetical protein
VDVSQSANLNVLLARLSDSLTGMELPEGTKLEAMRFEENVRPLPLLQDKLILINTVEDHHFFANVRQF